MARISGVYFQSYQLAWQMAKRAEAAYNFDLANYDAAYVSFLQPSYWDNLHQGLLAAEGLMYDIERMESSLVDNNFREFEIVRPISLSPLAAAFNTLITTGTRFFSLLESLFDADYPGHYMRRIQLRGPDLHVQIREAAARVCELHADADKQLHPHRRDSDDALCPYRDGRHPFSRPEPGAAGVHQQRRCGLQ